MHLTLQWVTVSSSTNNVRILYNSLFHLDPEWWMSCCFDYLLKVQVITCDRGAASEAEPSVPLLRISATTRVAKKTTSTTLVNIKGGEAELCFTSYQEPTTNRKQPKANCSSTRQVAPPTRVCCLSCNSGVLYKWLDCPLVWCETWNAMVMIQHETCTTA